MKKTSVERRTFMKAALATSAGAVVGSQRAFAATEPGTPRILTTWNFGPGANAVGYPILAKGGTAIDAVEAAINYVELLEDEYWVGYGGAPNEIGETTLDAMILWGPTHDIGAVGCLKRVKKAISVARKVMEETQHTLIVGDDATRFAVRMGFTETSLTNAESNASWSAWAAKGERTNAFDPERIKDPSKKELSGEKPEDPVTGHDTVGSIAIDAAGQLCVGCSTNGREFKIPGRVGDSPIPGAGAYGDQSVGGAVATGDGDVMMRFLPTYHAVELMRSGMSAAEAAQAAITRITGRGYQFDGAVIAMRMDGDHGAAKSGWADEGFSYSVQDGAGNVRFDVG